MLFTKWVGEAWEEVSSNKDMIVRSFRKVGIALAIDGSEDGDININGLENYTIEEDHEESEDEDSEDGESEDDDSEDIEDDSDEDPFSSCSSDGD